MRGRAGWRRSLLRTRSRPYSRCECAVLIFRPSQPLRQLHDPSQASALSTCPTTGNQTPSCTAGKFCLGPEPHHVCATASCSELALCVCATRDRLTALPVGLLELCPLLEHLDVEANRLTVPALDFRRASRLSTLLLGLNSLSFVPVLPPGILHLSIFTLRVQATLGTGSSSSAPRRLDPRLVFAALPVQVMTPTPLRTPCGSNPRSYSAASSHGEGCDAAGTTAACRQGQRRYPTATVLERSSGRAAGGAGTSLPLIGLVPSPHLLASSPSLRSPQLSEPLLFKARCAPRARYAAPGAPAPPCNVLFRPRARLPRRLCRHRRSRQRRLAPRLGAPRPASPCCRAPL